jgi:hypothetical protein
MAEMRKRERGRDQSPKIPFKGIPAMNLKFPLGSSS